ncbi:DUF4185 domain-containing protein [Candidatus Sumerlaeota bacterium]|nr:DUF4185 domain-containing protein [Candidatus Sumerlaeota bacterium]
MRKMKSLRVVLWGMFLFLLLVNVVLGTNQDTTTPPFEVISANVDPLYDGLLKFRERGWLGADGAVSVPLGHRKIVWLFGDTIIGVLKPGGKRTGMIIRNSIGLQDLNTTPPGRVTFYWDITDGVPGSFFMAENFERDFIYWPLTATQVDGELFVFAPKIFTKEPDRFSVGELHLLRVPNPLEPPPHWKKIVTPLGVGRDHQQFCAAAYVEKPYIYLLGFDESPTEKPTERRMVLARANIHRLKQGPARKALEFWVHGEKGNHWAPEPENLVTLFKPGTTESSIQYFPAWKQYVALTHIWGKPEILMVSAPALTGPWSKPMVIYTVPEMALDKNYVLTAVKAHPELARAEDEIVLTYVINTTDFFSLFTNPHIYYPRFVRVKLKWKGTGKIDSEKE